MTAQTIALARAMTIKIKAMGHNFEKEEIIKWLDENNLDTALYEAMHTAIYVVCEDWDNSKRWNFFNPCTQERSDTLNKFFNELHQYLAINECL